MVFRRAHMCMDVQMGPIYQPIPRSAQCSMQVCTIRTHGVHNSHTHLVGHVDATSILTSSSAGITSGNSEKATNSGEGGAYLKDTSPRL